MTNSQEEYIKTIYILANSEKEIRVTDIAKRLKITKPSVNKAMKNLKELGFIEYEAYGPIRLTKKGKKTAQEILKRYDLIKMFLTEVLDVEETQAEEEAKSMKYAISKETEEKLEKYINTILKLGELDCGYDINNEKCRNCVKVKAKNRLKKKEIQEEAKC